MISSWTKRSEVSFGFLDKGSGYVTSAVLLFLFIFCGLVCCCAMVFGFLFFRPKDAHGEYKKLNLKSGGNIDDDDDDFIDDDDDEKIVNGIDNHDAFEGDRQGLEMIQTSYRDQPAYTDEPTKSPPETETTSAEDETAFAKPPTTSKKNKSKSKTKSKSKSSKSSKTIANGTENKEDQQETPTENGEETKTETAAATPGSDSNIEDLLQLSDEMKEDGAVASGQGLSMV